MRKELVKNWRAKGHQYLARKALAMFARGYVGVERALEALMHAGLSQDYSMRLLGSKSRQREMSLKMRNMRAAERRAAKKKEKEKRK